MRQNDLQIIHKGLRVWPLFCWLQGPVIFPSHLLPDFTASMVWKVFLMSKCFIRLHSRPLYPTVLFPNSPLRSLSQPPFPWNTSADITKGFLSNFHLSNWSLSKMFLALIQVKENDCPLFHVFLTVTICAYICWCKIWLTFFSKTLGLGGA